ncbi:MAG: histidine kinase [Lachnospiraceae bacterium]|nr:histidine kinase [Lachnospiraceae bacterium]
MRKGICEYGKRLARCWYSRYRDWKLAAKMILMYVVMLGACFLFSVTALQYSFNIYDSKLYEKSLLELDFFTQQVNRSLDEVEDLSFFMAVDTKIQEQLTKIKKMKHFTSEYSYEIYQFRMILNTELLNSNMISNVLYTDGEGTRLLVGTDTGSIPQRLYDSFSGQLHQAQGAYLVHSPSPEYPYLLSGRDIRKHIDASLEYLGTLLITSDVTKMIEKNIDNLEAESSELCIYSEEGIIYESREGLTEQVVSMAQIQGTQGYRIVKQDGQQNFVCYLKSSRTGWTYVNVFPYTEIYGQNQRLRRMIFCGFLLLFVTSALALKKAAHIITKPLEHLSKSMEIVETGDFTGAKLMLEGGASRDEIGLLTQEFQVMLDKIDYLIHENYEKQILLKDTKYKMLQAQINPHFLYNTLNSINWMIRAKKNDEAAEMTVALGVILRSALNKQQFFTIQEELENLEKYLTIQKYRYRNRVVFQVDACCSGRYLIPHMTLQPLVENAIYHGVEKMLTVCTISVTVREEEAHLWIQVADDGPGMTQEELDKVRTFTMQPKGHGIGLKNIYERLKMAFNQDAEFQIDSAEKKGTCVTIRIPKREAEKEHDEGTSGR